MRATTSVGNDPGLDDLIRRCKDGDHDAFDRLTRRFEPWIVRLATRITGHPETGKDVAQETFLRAFRDIRSYSERYSFTTWLFHIARNLSLNETRRGPLDVGAWSLRLDIRHDPAPDARAQTRETSAEIARAVRSLRPRYRDVVILRFVEDLAVPAIAERIGVTENAVWVRLSRAMRLLRDRLGGYL